MSQPRALYVLAATELWERYGFYVIQGLLVLFLTQYYFYSDKQSYVLLGEFTALSYIAPILGGFIADQLLGVRPTISLSIVLLCAGYFVLSLLQVYLLRIGLALVVMGNGLLKPNISSFLGRFYESGDPRREAGFTIFYVGISLGIILSTLTSGWIVEKFGWSAAFLTASLGMMLAFLVFMMGYRCFANRGSAIKVSDITFKFNRFLANRVVLSGLLLLVTGLFCIMLLSDGVAIYTQLSLAFILVLLFFYGMVRCEKSDRHNLIILALLLLISVMFWSLFFQLYLSLTLFIKRVVDRQLWGVQIPTVMFGALEPFFVVTLGLFVSRLWRRIAARKRNPTYIAKFGLSMIFATMAMSLLVLAIRLTPASALINPWWIVCMYLFITLGEMMLYPIGMAMVTVLVPKKFTGVMMGVWFMSLGFGGMLAGHLAQLADIPIGTTSIYVIKYIYLHAFSMYAIIALIVVAIVFSLYVLFKKLGIRVKPV